MGKDEVKVACITGASSGIGEAVARGLAEDGYSVALLARRADLLASLAADIERQCNVQALAVPTDISIAPQVDRAIAEISQRWGRIDIIFNNAAINYQGTLDLSLESFDEMLNTNIRGAFAVLKAAVPLLKRQGFGYIINTASMSAKIGFPGSGAYSATKFALHGLSDSLFRELIPLGIKVTSLCPSWVDTAMPSFATFSRAQMMSTEDILATVRYLLTLSPQVCPKEVVLECVRDFGRR